MWQEKCAFKLSFIIYKMKKIISRDILSAHEQQYAKQSSDVHTKARICIDFDSSSVS